MTAIARLMKINAHFAQGARCGHIDGKRRVGVYVIDEEHDLAGDAANASCADTRAAPRYHWANGYAYGYRCGAEGFDLPMEIVVAPLPGSPEAKAWTAEILDGR